MKKNIVLVFIIVLTIVISGCGTEKDNFGYIGNYENEPGYQKIMIFENSKDPEQMVEMLENLYIEPVTYIPMKFDVENKKYFEPYEDFEFEVLSIYSPDKSKGLISSDSYAFFVGETEVPIFIMDQDGSYLVSDYEVVTGDNDYVHKVTAWAMSDFYLCLHGYAECNNDENLRMIYKNIVKSLDFYTDFEARLLN